MSDPHARIAELEAALAAAQREMQAFTYTVSHDLRAPLRHIVSYAQLVQEDAGPQLGADVQGFLATITDSARHLSAMLDGLLELSRIGTVPVQWAEVPLQTLVQEVMTELERAGANAAVQWHIAPVMPVVRADAALLRQALLQVLGNALKFSGPRAQPVIGVDVAVDLVQGTVGVTVRDNGVGLRLAGLDTAFPPFQRLHPKAQFAGLGMGLALAHKGLQRMGVSLQVASTVEEGCSVSLTGLQAVTP